MKIFLQFGFALFLISFFTNCEKIDTPTEFAPSPIYMIGSSTMNYKYRSPYIKGWGDCISDYLKNPNMAKNRGRAGSVAGIHEERGYSTTNYLVHSHNDWNKTVEEIKNDEFIGENGGFLLIQFGANEGRANISNDEYYNNLKIYIDEARNLNVIPVLVTTPVGRSTINSPFGRSLERINIKRKLAEDEGVLLLDLYAKTIEYTLKLKEENENSTIKRLGYRFGHIGYDESAHDHNFFNSDFFRIDRGHFEPHGAKLIAGWIRYLACEKADINEDAEKLCQQFNTDSLTATPTIYSDGEHRDEPGNNDYNGWRIFDTSNNSQIVQNPDNTIISQSIKEGKENKTGKDCSIDYRVHDLDSQNRRYFYIHGAQSPISDNAWHNTKQKNISWTTDLDDIQVYIYVLTKNGFRTLYYEDLDNDRGINPNNQNSIRFGVGVNTTNKWYTFNRNLEKDLQKFEPQNSLIKVNGFGIYGKGHIDELKMY